MFWVVDNFLMRKKKKLTNQELFELVTVSLSLTVLMSDSRVILSGEIRCLSLLGCIGLVYI